MRGNAHDSNQIFPVQTSGVFSDTSSNTGGAMDLDWDFPDPEGEVRPKAKALKKKTSKAKPKAMPKEATKVKKVAKRPTCRAVAASTSQTAVTLGSCCSGLGTDEFAMRKLRVDSRPLFFVELNKGMRQHLEANFPTAEVMVSSKTKRFQLKAPTVDIFSAGFPCQPFSVAGLGGGADDKYGRGTVFYDILKYLTRAHPKAFVLENVRGLVVRHKETFEGILEA